MSKMPPQDADNEEQESDETTQEDSGGEATPDDVLVWPT